MQDHAAHPGLTIVGGGQVDGVALAGARDRIDADRARERRARGRGLRRGGSRRTGRGERLQVAQLGLDRGHEARARVAPQVGVVERDALRWALAEGGVEVAQQLARLGIEALCRGRHACRCRGLRGRRGLGRRSRRCRRGLRALGGWRRHGCLRRVAHLEGVGGLALDPRKAQRAPRALHSQHADRKAIDQLPARDRVAHLHAAVDGQARARLGSAGVDIDEDVIAIDVHDRGAQRLGLRWRLLGRERARQQRAHEQAQGGDRSDHVALAPLRTTSANHGPRFRSVDLNLRI